MLFRRTEVLFIAAIGHDGVRFAASPKPHPDMPHIVLGDVLAVLGFEAADRMTLVRRLRSGASHEVCRVYLDDEIALTVPTWIARSIVRGFAGRRRDASGLLLRLDLAARDALAERIRLLPPSARVRWVEVALRQSDWSDAPAHGGMA